MGLTSVDFRALDLRELDRLAEDLGHYDQVLCLEVIEHILDDRKLLRDFARLTRARRPTAPHDPVSRPRPLRRRADQTEDEDGGHVRAGYTHEEMERLLVEAGFR